MRQRVKGEQKRTPRFWHQFSLSACPNAGRWVARSAIWISESSDNRPDNASSPEAEDFFMPYKLRCWNRQQRMTTSGAIIQREASTALPSALGAFDHFSIKIVWENMVYIKHWNEWYPEGERNVFIDWTTLSPYIGQTNPRRSSRDERTKSALVKMIDQSTTNEKQHTSMNWRKRVYG